MIPFLQKGNLILALYVVNLSGIILFTNQLLTVVGHNIATLIGLNNFLTMSGEGLLEGFQIFPLKFVKN